jgi:CHAT domain-containing protein
LLPYLFIKQPIRYAPSLKSYLQETSEPLPQSPSILAYAYSGSGNSAEKNTRQKLSELPGSSKELKQIQQIFGGFGTFRFGDESTLQHFLTNCKKQHDILHLALHASSDPYNRWNTKIYFRPKNETDTTNVLHAFEVISLPLDVGLAVLTSCQTLTGTTEKGEGTYSLAQAFLQAGASSVVASLWSVEDYSTSVISRQFYSNLKNGKMPSSALRQAKLDYLRSEDDFWTHPRCWAGIVCMGK